MADQHGKSFDLTALNLTSSFVDFDFNNSGVSPLDAELIELLLHGDLEVDASSSSSALSWGAAYGDGSNDMSKVLRETQELAIANRTLRETCAEWVGAIRHSLSNLREVTVERDGLLQHITRLADGDDSLLQRIQMFHEVYAAPRNPLISDLPGGDQLAALTGSTTGVSASTLAPEIYEVPVTRLSVSPQRRLSAPYYETVFEQTLPTTSFNESHMAVQFVEAREAEQAEVMVPQQTGDRQEGRRRKRRRRHRRRMDTSTSNGQHEVPSQTMAQINQEQAQVPRVALHTPHQQAVHLNHAPNRRQLGRRRRRHNLLPSLTYSIRPSSNYLNATLIVDIFPKAAAAA